MFKNIYLVLNYSIFLKKYFFFFYYDILKLVKCHALTKALQIKKKVIIVCWVTKHVDDNL